MSRPFNRAHSRHFSNDWLNPLVKGIIDVPFEKNVSVIDGHLKTVRVVIEITTDLGANSGLKNRVGHILASGLDPITDSVK